MNSSDQLPKISVITPTLSQGGFIEETILSVLNQDYPQLEYIVIDGGSTDSTLEILHKYKKSIGYWISEPDSGQADAINKGFRRATGDLLCWINSDDILLPSALHRVAELFDPELSKQMILGDVEIENLCDSSVWLARQHGVTRENMIRNWMGSRHTWLQPGTFVSRGLFQEVGPLDAGLHLTFDREWMIRLLGAAPVVKYLDKPVARFRLHPASKTVSKPEKWVNEQILVTSRFICDSPRFAAYARAETEVCWGALPLLDASVRKVNRRGAWGWLRRAVRSSSAILLSKRWWLGLFLSFMPASLIEMVMALLSRGAGRGQGRT